MPIGDVVGGIGSLVGGAIVAGGGAGKGGEDSLKRAVMLAEAIQLPDFDFSKLSPPELQLVAELFPEVYETHVPDEYKTIVEQPEGREAQLQALDYFRSYGEEDLPLAERLATDRASQGIMGGVSAGNQAAIERSQRMGLRGGGDLSAITGQNMTNLASQLGASQQEAAIGARQRAMENLAGIGGQMRGQDINVAGQNANIANRFNRAIADDYNRAAEYAAGARERTQGYNVGERQRIADTNVQQNYLNRQYNQGRITGLEQQQFQNEVTKTAAIQRALEALAKGEYAEQAAKANAIQGAGRGGGQAVGGVGGLF